MNVTALKKRVYERLEQDPNDPVTTEAAVLHALNQAQQTLVLMTLCIEKTVSVTFPAREPIVGIRALLPDYLRPLRVRVGPPSCCPDPPEGA